MPCLRECECAGVVYTVYLAAGERIGNIPWQVGKEERNEGGKRKRLGRQERSERGNKKDKVERGKRKRDPGEASPEECRLWRGPGNRPGCRSDKAGASSASRRGHGHPGPSPTSPANLGPASSPGSQAWVQRFPRALFSPPSWETTGWGWTRVGRPPGAPVPDCLGALGQAFQLAGPDLSGGLSSREINRGGGLQ